jgi:hypothetical protein
MTAPVRRKTTITKLALMAAATAAAAIALSATAHADDTQYANFLSPSGNINCSIMLLPPFAVNGVDYSGNNIVQCELVDHTWQPPQACATASEVVGVSMRADATAPPVVDCEKYPNQLPLPWPTLDYGQKQTLGVITCDSEPSGITCTNTDTGLFFRVSSESYDVG